MIRLAVFDWNATLFADASACLHAQNAVFKRYNAKPVSMARFRASFNVPVSRFYEANGLGSRTVRGNSDGIARLFHSTYEPRASRCRMRKGVRKLLAWLKARGFESVILSDHTVAGIKSQLVRLKMEGFFSAVLANPYVGISMRRRTKLSRLRSFMRRSSFSPGETVVIGDSPQETEIARALGAGSIAITGGFYSTARLKAEKPDYIIDSLIEAIGLVKKHGAKGR